MKLAAHIKRKPVAIAIALVALAGIAMLASPILSDWWSGVQQRNAINGYDQAVVDLDPNRCEELLAQAEQYNAELTRTGINWDMSDEQMERYHSLLDVDGEGMMGYVYIPKINVELPIYHGTKESVLEMAAGHLAGTSLPVGGVGSHCSVSGHRGLPSARLLTDLGRLDVGDIFTVTVLNRVCTYEVDQVRIVLPAELRDLEIDPAQDYFTLVTCTPYGENSHRLLVRGHRTNNRVDADLVPADADWIRPRQVAMYLAIVVLVCIAVWAVGRRMHWGGGRRKAEESSREHHQRLEQDMEEDSNEHVEE